MVGIPVVTSLALLTVPVAAADSGNARLPRFRAFEIGLQLADSGVHDHIALAAVCGTSLPVGYRRVAQLDAAGVEGN
jgi:hypothetical protein